MAAGPTQIRTFPPPSQSVKLVKMSGAIWSDLHFVHSDSCNFMCVGTSEAQCLSPAGEELRSYFQSLPEKIHISVKSQINTFAITRENKYVKLQSRLGKS